MANRRLVSYLREIIAEGYDISKIRQSVLRAGYRQTDFDEAMLLINGPLDWKKVSISAFAMVSISLLSLGMVYIGLRLIGSIFGNYLLLLAMSATTGLVVYRIFKAYPDRYFIRTLVPASIVLYLIWNPVGHMVLDIAASGLPYLIIIGCSGFFEKRF